MNALSQPKVGLWPVKFAYREAWLDVGGGVEDAVLVAGVGRSGTTWLGEVIASATRSREVFEPFLVDPVGRFALASGKHEPCGAKYLPNYSQCILPDLGCASEHYADVEKILDGRVRSWWTEQGMRPGIYKRRVIKDIRSNLMLGWLANCWPELKIVYVVRDPISTVTSMLERSSVGWKFDWDPEYVLREEKLMNGPLKPFKTLLEVPHSHASRLMLRWCVENYLALEQVSSKANVAVVNYDVLAKDRSLWKGIFQHIGWQWDQELFEKHVNVRSRTSASGQAPQKPHLDKEQLALLLSMVNQFGLSNWVAD